MSKTLLVAGVILFVVLILGTWLFVVDFGRFAMFLGGVSEELVEEDEDRFVGTWENQIGAEVVFASNGSYYTSTSGWICNWSVGNGKLIYSYDNGDSSSQDFSFSDDDNTLTVHMAGGDIVCTKKQ